MNPIVPIIILFGIVHYVFDWVLQTRRIANSKSKSWLVLYEHVIIVTMGLGITAFFLSNIQTAVVFALVNGIAHFVTDAVTSRLTTYFYTNGKDKAFWNTIGADQWLLHFPVLVVTIEWLLV